MLLPQVNARSANAPDARTREVSGVRERSFIAERADPWRLRSRSCTTRRVGFDDQCQVSRRAIANRSVPENATLLTSAAHRYCLALPASGPEAERAGAGRARAGHSLRPAQQRRQCPRMERDGITTARVLPRAQASAYQPPSVQRHHVVR